MIGHAGTHESTGLAKINFVSKEKNLEEKATLRLKPLESGPCSE